MRHYIRFILVTAVMSLGSSGFLIADSPTPANDIQQFDFFSDEQGALLHPGSISLRQETERYQLLAQVSPSNAEEGKRITQSDRDESVKKFREDYRFKKNIHKIMGLSAVAFGVATALTAPDGDDDDDDGDEDDDEEKEGTGLHRNLAYATLATSAAAVSLGFIELGKDVYWLSAWEKENYHAAFGTLGAGLLIAAVQQAPNIPHQNLGMIGGILMGVSIAIIW